MVDFGVKRRYVNRADYPLRRKIVFKKWKGGQCRILLLARSTLSLLAWQYLEIKKLFPGVTDDELRFVRIDSKTEEEMFHGCVKWEPEAVLVSEDSNHKHLAELIGGVGRIYPFLFFDEGMKLQRLFSERKEGRQSLVWVPAEEAFAERPPVHANEKLQDALPPDTDDVDFP